MSTLADALPRAAEPDAVYDAFEAWVDEQGLELYPHQEEAVIELLERRARRAGHADGLGQVAGGGGGAFRRAGRGAVDVLHGADQGARVGEVLRAVRDFGAAHVGMLTGDAAVNSAGADHLLHGGGARQRRAAAGRGRAGRPGRDGRVPLLRRARARLGVAGAAAGVAAGAVRADVGDARGHDGHRRRPHAPHRSRDGDRGRRGAAGAAVVRLVGGAAARAARGAGAADRAPIYVVHFTQATRQRARAGAAVGQALHPRGEREAIAAPSAGSASPPGSAGRSRSWCAAGSACTTPACCRGTGGWSSSSRRPGCSR